MEIEQITMDKNAAREHFKRYRDLVRKRATKEDVVLMRAFKALSKGQPIIDLFVTMKKIGLDERFRPKVAICRADAEKVYYRHGENGAGAFSGNTNFYSLRNALRISFPAGIFATVDAQSRWGMLEALVPVVPAHLRPAAALSNYHVLWEPEWDEEPPRDPILLKRIAHFTFVMLAQWDLTELERSILRGV